MGFIREEFVGYECDKCRRILEDSEGYSFHVDEERVREKMDEQHWQKIDGKWYCPHCCHWEKEKDDWAVNEDNAGKCL